MGTVLKYVILSAVKDLLFYGGESRSFALLRMTCGSGSKNAGGSWFVGGIGAADTGSFP